MGQVWENPLVGWLWLGLKKLSGRGLVTGFALQGGRSPGNNNCNLVKMVKNVFFVQFLKKNKHHCNYIKTVLHSLIVFIYVSLANIWKLYFN
jgi:hypothetical protein